jgi:excisionase family DNA binding protein
MSSARSAIGITAATDIASVMMTVGDVAALLRTSGKAIYAMVERRQLPGVIRIGRRLLFRRAEVLSWLDHTCTSSPKENRR